MVVLEKLYKALNFACDVDITRVLLWPLQAHDNYSPGDEQLIGVESSIATPHQYSWVTQADLFELQQDSFWKVTSDFINDYVYFGFRGVVCRVDGELAGMIFLSTGLVDARHNSGGANFTGMGLDLPSGVHYVFKVAVKPSHRGARMSAGMITFAARQIAIDGGLAIVTTTDISNHAFLRVLESVGFKRVALAGEIVLAGKRFHRLPGALPILSQVINTDRTRADAIHFTAG